MKKKNYCVRDVIPDTPDGFYDTVERSLAACRDEGQKRTWDGFRLPRKWMLPLVAALVLLIAGTAVAASTHWMVPLTLRPLVSFPLRVVGS